MPRASSGGGAASGAPGGAAAARAAPSSAAGGGGGGAADTAAAPDDPWWDAVAPWQYALLAQLVAAGAAGFAARGARRRGKRLAPGDADDYTPLKQGVDPYYGSSRA